ncbi:MAG: DUF2332 domain-containing protein, partial [Anaerolineae bacterium]|nr:DUF2332 domain-containing protein [Anaerolineae bacterium]
WEDRPLKNGMEASLIVSAAIHAAVLDGDPAADELRPFYATVGGLYNGETAAFEKALGSLFQNPGKILPWFLREGHIQTNEISRAVTWLLSGYVFQAWQPDLTVTLVELGTSAGLILTADYQSWLWKVSPQHFYSLNRPPWLIQQQIHVPDDDDSGLLAAYPYEALPPLPVLRRVGFDANPLYVHDPADRLLLEACIWGDQPERLERFRQAVGGYDRMKQAGQPLEIYKGDILEAAELLPNLIPADVPKPHLLLVYNSAVTVYMAPPEYEQLKNTVIQSLSRLPEGVVGLWLENEPPRHNETVERSHHFLLKARLPFLGGMSTVYLAEQEAHPQNMYLRGEWTILRGLMGW